MASEYPDGHAHLTKEQQEAYDLMEPLLLHAKPNPDWEPSPIQPAMTELRLLNAWLKFLHRFHDDTP